MNHDPFNLTKYPVRLDCRIVRGEPGIPDCIQTRLKLTDSEQDKCRYANIDMMYGDAPDDFIVLEEIRIIADEIQKLMFPRLRWRRVRKERNSMKEEMFYCPLCGAENPEKIYEVPGQGAVGCDECLCAYEPLEYFENREVIG